MMKTILYITWDSDKTNYLESLFFPIFSGLQQTGAFRMVVYQFSWTSEVEVQRLKNLALEMGIELIQHPIRRNAGRLGGTFNALRKGRQRIRKIIQTRAIDAVMPRSTMPAALVNSLAQFLKSRSIPVIFEADGFPIQERIDFSGLKPNSLQAKFLLNQEHKILKRADVVLTRSKKSIELHVERLEPSARSKFFAVSNGRDANQFSFDAGKRGEIRELLGVESGEICWVYVGSLGPAYAYQEMLSLFDTICEKSGNLKFLVLPNDLEFAQTNLKSKFPDRIIIRKIPFQEIPAYLSAADLGLSFRKPAPSLAGLFPIKLGEYLLCGLPVLASLEVGDTRSWSSKISGILGVQLSDPEFLISAERVLIEKINWDRSQIREEALPVFSLDQSVKEYGEALAFLSQMKKS